MPHDSVMVCAQIGAEATLHAHGPRFRVLPYTASEDVGDLLVALGCVPPLLKPAPLDHLDRLTTWTLNGATQTYAYNAIGNITSKPGVGSYTYRASGASSTRPHTPSAVNGAAYTYDANGNLLTGGGRTYTWTVDNLPLSISQTSGSESYSYDADGERVRRCATAPPML